MLLTVWGIGGLGGGAGLPGEVLQELIQVFLLVLEVAKVTKKCVSERGMVVWWRV